MSRKLYLLIMILPIFTSHGFAQMYPTLEETQKRADQYKANQQYDSALLIYQSLALKANVVGNPYYSAMANLGQGSVLCVLHGCEFGIEYYRKAYDLITEYEIDSVIHKALVALGAGYQELNKLDSALTFYERGLHYFEINNDSSNMAIVLNNKAGIYFANGEYEKAIESFLASSKLMFSAGNLTGTVDALYNIGVTYQVVQDLDSALFYLEKSLVLADSLSLPKKIAYAYYSMGEIWEAKKEPVNALKYFKLYDEFNQTFLTDVYNSSLADLDAKYQTSQIQLESEARLRVADKRSREKVMVLVLSASLLVVSVIIVWWTIQRKRSVEKIAAKNQQLANQKINDLLQQQEINSLQGVLAGQEEERQRIASDLHDKLGAILGMVKLHFSAVEERIDILRDDNKKQYDKANELLDQASTEVRNISHNLLSGVLVKFGLVPALHDLKDTVEATDKLKIQLVIGEQMDARLSGEQELQVYRIVQELLSNILKHARATETVIQFHRTNGEMTLVVEDNGMGFDIESAKAAGGMGLKNLEARAAKLNAHLHFDSGKGAGTTITVTIPMEGESS